jgi:hypothetical protein
MTKMFNTAFEVSLRILLVLESAPLQWWTTDRIAAFDFITVYGGEFGITDENLHGENRYKYSEFTLRRELVKNALKTLVSQQFADVESTKDGFVYALGKLGGDYCADLDSDYAESYRKIAKVVNKQMLGKTDREVMGLINRNSISSLRRSVNDG